jgi:hypothetical protein
MINEYEKEKQPEEMVNSSESRKPQSPARNRNTMATAVSSTSLTEVQRAIQAYIEIRDALKGVNPSWDVGK